MDKCSTLVFKHVLKMKIAGYFFNGKTSKQLNAYLEVDPTRPTAIFITLKDDENTKITIPLSDVNIASRLGNTPRELALGEGRLFVTNDNDAVDAFVNNSQKSQAGRFIHKFESKLSLVVLATVLTVAFIWSFVVFGIPASAKFIANQMPVMVSEQLGSSLDVLDKTVFKPSELDEARKEHITNLVAPYVAEFEILNTHLAFRSGMGANALALPSGDIVFTDEFVNLAKNDNELLAIFFHEIGHLKHKHLARRVLQDTLITLMVVLITGDVESVDIVTALPTLLLDLSYSRKFETEADTFALQKLHKENIPLKSFSNMMQRFEDSYSEEKESKNNNGLNIPAFLSTHPMTKERIKLAESFIQQYKN